ncbi:MAG: phosphoribosylamine--glycine ligase [Bdellovibrionales bacterium]
MKTLVIGSGGREHALCWAFSKSPLTTELYCAPGNPGIADVATCLDIKVDDIDGLVAKAKELEIDFVMVGPELPLTLGLVDRLEENGIITFGPSQAAAALEGSKGFTKDLCKKYGIPTGAYERFTDAAKAKDYVRQTGTPTVIKADGLAAGKGVTIAQNEEEAFAAIDDALSNGAFGTAGAEIVIEEFLRGEEASFFALSDGETAIPFATAQDHKAVYDGDKGPNTGGMGAYSPASNIELGDALSERVMKEIIIPTVKGMKAEGTPYKGMLYAGLMITDKGPELIEYNARFGDPETQAMIPRMESDLLAVLYATAKGIVDALELKWKNEKALCVVMAANGYPGKYEKGSVIRNLDEANKIENGIVFHAGTAQNEAGDIVAAGGRVLGVTGWAPTVTEAQKKAYEAVDKINWPEGFCRRDIGYRAVAREKK